MSSLATSPAPDVMLTRSCGEQVTLLIKVQPTEFYNLAAQSHVHTSFELPVYTAHVDGIGTLNCLEAIRQAGLAGKTKFYQVKQSLLLTKRAEDCKLCT